MSLQRSYVLLCFLKNCVRVLTVFCGEIVLVCLPSLVVFVG